MPIDKNKFQEIQRRAKEIIDRDIRGELDAYAKNVKANVLNEGELSFDVQSTTTQPTQQYAPQPTRIPSNSKLPKAILESFATNQIDIPQYTGSVLDDLGVPYEENTQNVRQVPNERKMVVKENKQPIASNIDYSLIKTIVEDCVKKGMAALKKSMLTENTNNGNQLALMKIGDGFKFVASNGDIYEAKLIKKGNVNERKKAMQLQENNK